MCPEAEGHSRGIFLSQKNQNNISFIVTFLLLAVNKIFKIIHLHSRCPHYWHTVGLEVLQFAPRCFSKLPKISLKLKTCLETPSLTKSCVIPSTLLYYISLLSGYGHLDNLHNQCKDPMDNDRNCRVGQLTRPFPGRQHWPCGRQRSCI